MIPKIDYRLIGDAIEYYTKLGYEYVELPWVVPASAIRATLPEGFSYLEIASRHNNMLHPHAYPSCLIGSAEQAFLTMDLGPGPYVACTPCFRDEPAVDLFHREMFMKVELFSRDEAANTDAFVNDATEFFECRLSRNDQQSLTTVQTNIGKDITLAGIEIGSYGERTHEQYGRWVYGTGLAEPRFSVARALCDVL